MDDMDREIIKITGFQQNGDPIIEDQNGNIGTIPFAQAYQQKVQEQLNRKPLGINGRIDRLRAAIRILDESLSAEYGGSGHSGIEIENDDWLGLYPGDMTEPGLTNDQES